MNISSKVVSAFLVAMLVTVCAVVIDSTSKGMQQYSSPDTTSNDRISTPLVMPSFTELSTGDSSGYYSAVSMGDVDGTDGMAEILSGGHARSGPTKGLYLWRYTTSWNVQTITTEGSYGGVALDDFTGDGILDVAAAGDTVWGSDEVRGLALWKGAYSSSTITFSSLSSPYTSTSADCVEIADINHDGKKDVILGTNGDDIQVFINNGGSSPTWTTVTVSATSETCGVAVVDLNKDTNLDIVATNYNGVNSRVFLCTGIAPSVTFGTAHTSGLSTSTAFGIGVSDLNKDGEMDLAIGTRSYGLKVYFGNGCSGADSTWWSDASAPSVGSGDKMQVSVADINGDSWTDIAVATDGAGLAVLENNAGASFTHLHPSGVPNSGEYYGCFLFDFDGDSDMDLAGCGWGSGVRFYRNDLTSATPDISNGVLAAILIAGTAVLALVLTSRKKLQ